jgi:hypothetical protein
MKTNEKKINDMSKSEKVLEIAKINILSNKKSLTTEELNFIALMEIIDVLAGMQSTLDNIYNK